MDLGMISRFPFVSIVKSNVLNQGRTITEPASRAQLQKCVYYMTLPRVFRDMKYQV